MRRVPPARSQSTRRTIASWRLRLTMKTGMSRQSSAGAAAAAAAGIQAQVLRARFHQQPGGVFQRHVAAAGGNHQLRVVAVHGQRELRG